MSFKSYHNDGALICDRCHIIIKHDTTLEESKKIPKPHLCKDCQNKEK